MSEHSDLEILALLARAHHELDARVAALARLPGPKGDQGDKGPPGDKGDKGDRGDQGRQGIQGKRGSDGKDGKQGEPGKRGARGESVKGDKGDRGPKGDKGDKGDRGERGPRGPKPDHDWDGTKLRFERPNGEWGEFVDLRGRPGASIIGVGGGSTTANPWNPDDLEEATDEIPEQFIVRQDGEWRRATYAQMLDWLGGGTLPPGTVTVNGGPVTVNGSTVTVT